MLQAAARLDHKNGTLNLGDKGLEGETRRAQLTNLAKGLQVSLDLMSQDKEERRQQKLMAFKELAERLEDERKMMDYRRQQIEERKELQEREAAQKVAPVPFLLPLNSLTSVLHPLPARSRSTGAACHSYSIVCQ